MQLTHGLEHTGLLSALNQNVQLRGFGHVAYENYVLETSKRDQGIATKPEGTYQDLTPRTLQKSEGVGRK